MKAKIHKTARFADVEIEAHLSVPVSCSLVAKLMENFLRDSTAKMARQAKELAKELDEMHGAQKKRQGTVEEIPMAKDLRGLFNDL